MFYLELLELHELSPYWELYNWKFISKYTIFQF